MIKNNFEKLGLVIPVAKRVGHALSVTVSEESHPLLEELGLIMILGLYI